MFKFCLLVHWQCILNALNFRLKWHYINFLLYFLLYYYLFLFSNIYVYEVFWKMIAFWVWEECRVTSLERKGLAKDLVPGLAFARSGSGSSLKSSSENFNCNCFLILLFHCRKFHVTQMMLKTELYFIYLFWSTCKLSLEKPVAESQWQSYKIRFLGERFSFGKQIFCEGRKNLCNSTKIILQVFTFL